MSNNSTDFILEYIPSFFRDMMKDDNGENLYTPIFNCMGNLFGDQYFQAKQINQSLNLEDCPYFINEFYTTIDTSVNNKYYFDANNKPTPGDNSSIELSFGYLIDPNIVSINQIFIDGNLSIKNNINYYIFTNTQTGEKIISFVKTINGVPTNCEIIQDTLFVDSVVKDKQILQNRWGTILDYLPNYLQDYLNEFPKYTELNIIYDKLKYLYTEYHQQLQAILILANYPTIEGLNKFVGIWNGFQYATKSGLVIDYTTIANLDGTITKYNENIKQTLLSTNVSKYDLLTDSQYIITDAYSNPSYFISLMSTTVYGYNVYDELIAQNNEDAEYLHYDSVVEFDDDNLSYDIGEFNSPKDNFIPYPNYYYIQYSGDISGDNALNQADQASLKYEMFRNVILMYYSIDIKRIDYFKSIIAKYIPSHSRMLYIKG